MISFRKLAVIASVSLSAIAAASPAVANTAGETTAANEGPELGTFGFDEKGMDRATAPGDNFYLFANGEWLKTTEIPADKSNYGMFTKLDDLSKERVKGLLEAAAKDPKSKMGVAYATYLDEAAIEKKGLAPIQSILKQVRAVKTHKQFEALLPTLAPKGVGALFGGFVGQDDKNPDAYIFQIFQGGTGLPDRDMYLVDNPKFEEIRTAYKSYLTKMLMHAGEKNAEARANAIFETEKKIAEVQWTREESSDATKVYNKIVTSRT
jgi:putative endopeptidase